MRRRYVLENFARRDLKELQIAQVAMIGGHAVNDTTLKPQSVIGST